MTATLAVTDSMCMVLHLNQQALLLEVGNNSLAAFLTRHTCIFACFLGHDAVHADNDDAGQVVTNAHFIVVGVVRRRNFYSAGTKLGINIAVGDNGDNSIRSRQTQGFAHQIAITRILGVNCYSGIAGQRLRTGGGNHQVASLLLNYRIVNIPQMARVILMLYLDVTQSGVAVYAPVGDAGALVNQTLFKQAAKHLADSARAALVHSKALTLPVAGNAQMLQLVDNAVAVLLLPRPYAL